MDKNRRRTTALLLSMCLMSLVLCASYRMPPDYVSPEPEVEVLAYELAEPIEEEAVVEETPAATPRAENAIDMYINGVLRGECLLIESRAYISLANFAAYFGLECEGETIGGLTLNLAASGEYVEVNGRYLWMDAAVREENGETLWPLSLLAKVFSCTVSWDEESSSVDVDATSFAPLASGDEFYSEEDVLWLSRIIFAESGNQDMPGMIAVGNVIINRVESDAFPDTVYDVIFDTQYGVQFSPADNGSIYCDPDEEAIIAAKLCLDGASVAGESLYFVNPEIGADNWFKETKTFYATIGDHDFYL